MIKITELLSEKDFVIKNNNEKFVFAQTYINNKPVIVRCVKIYKNYELELAILNNFKLNDLSIFESENENGVIENILSFINNIK